MGMTDVVCPLVRAQASRTARTAWANGIRATMMRTLVRATFLIPGLCAGDESIVGRDLVYMISSCCVNGAPSEPRLFPELLPLVVIIWLVGLHFVFSRAAACTLTVHGLLEFRALTLHRVCDSIYEVPTSY